MNIADRIRKIDNVSTVFTITEIKILLNIDNQKNVYDALFYAAHKGEMYKISDGIYSFNKNYSKTEFANKYRRPSYISLYTVLQKAGIVFQPYAAIYVITNRSEDAKIDNQKYIYRKIKDEILLNPPGIEYKNGVHNATPERAICDKLYLDGDEYFDNLKDINWDFMKKINKNVYQNNSTIIKFIAKHSK